MDNNCQTVIPGVLGHSQILHLTKNTTTEPEKANFALTSNTSCSSTGYKVPLVPTDRGKQMNIFTSNPWQHNTLSIEKVQQCPLPVRTKVLQIEIDAAKRYALKLRGKHTPPQTSMDNKQTHRREHG